jgi:protein-disulfide isomerase
MTKNRIADTLPSRGLTALLTAVVLFGMGLTVFIELSHYSPRLAAVCGVDGGGCADINATPYAKIFGVPTAAWGFLAYGVTLLSILYARQWTLPLVAAMMGAELYFFWLMASVIHIWCSFCLVQFGVVTVLLAVALPWSLSVDRWGLPGKLWSVPVVIVLSFFAFAAPVKLAAKSSSSPSAVGDLLTFAGNPDSPLVVEVFSDYECGHCRKYDPVVEMIADRNPEVLLVYRDYIFPGNKLSPVAASYLNTIALRDGVTAYRKERAALFANQSRLYDHLKEKLPTVTFDAASKKEVAAKVAADLKRAEAFNVYSTPTTVITRNGETVQILRGAQDYDKVVRFFADRP